MNITDRCRQNLSQDLFIRSSHALGLYILLLFSFVINHFYWFLIMSNLRK